MIIWHDVEQGSQAWKILRAPLWTGSTAIRLLQGKAFRPASESDFIQRRGHALEVAAIREYERKFNVKVQRPGFITNTVYPNAGYSPDGIDRAWLLECKALEGVRHDDLIKDRKPIKNIEEIIASRIPLQFRVQIFFGMIISGKRKARLLAMNPELEEQLVVIEIGYDRLIGDNIRRKLKLDLKQRSSG
jgi:hypothetical protein